MLVNLHVNDRLRFDLLLFNDIDKTSAETNLEL